MARCPNGSVTLICPSSSHGGVVQGGTITWTLGGEGAGAGIPTDLSYQVRAADEPGPARFSGTVSEMGTPLEFAVGGDRQLFNPSGFSTEGFINTWLLLGPFGTCIAPLQTPCAPGEGVIRRDYLTDGGAVLEAELEPRAGDTVATDFNVAASCALTDPASAVPINPGGLPTWAAWHDRDDTIDFDDYYGGNLDTAMMYAVTYIFVEDALDVDLVLASDDAVQVLVDGEEVWINNICRPAGENNSIQDFVLLGDLFGTLEPGFHQIMVKVFEGGGGHKFRLRFQDPNTGLPVTEGIRVLLSPELEPETRFVRADTNADGGHNITDGVFLLNFLFLGGPTPTCLDAADADGKGGLNITDGVYVLNFLFLGGSRPPAPFPDCGTAEEVLGCDAFPCP